jgi:hypothetical protein
MYEPLIYEITISHYATAKEDTIRILHRYPGGAKAINLFNSLSPKSKEKLYQEVGNLDPEKRTQQMIIPLLVQVAREENIFVLTQIINRLNWLDEPLNQMSLEVSSLISKLEKTNQNN